MPDNDEHVSDNENMQEFEARLRNKFKITHESLESRELLDEPKPIVNTSDNQSDDKTE